MMCWPLAGDLRGTHGITGALFAGKLGAVLASNLLNILQERGVLAGVQQLSYSRYVESCPIILMLYCVGLSALQHVVHIPELWVWLHIIHFEYTVYNCISIEQHKLGNI